MSRFHVHVGVSDLEESVRFYSTLFGTEPSVVKDDYAKWMLDDPRVNFAISRRGGEPGINHLGFQVDDASELTDIQARLQAAQAGGYAEKSVSCCYARSDKYWTTDPSGVAWESFQSLGTVPYYHGEAAESHAGACCAGEGPGAKAEGAKSSCCAA